MVYRCGVVRDKTVNWIFMNKIRLDWIIIFLFFYNNTYAQFELKKQKMMKYLLWSMESAGPLFICGFLF